MSLPDVEYQVWLQMAVTSDQHAADLEQQRREARTAERRTRR